MKSDNPAHLIRVSLGEYDRYESRRLTREQLEEEQLYYLMMRTRSYTGPEAVVAPAFARNMRPELAKTALDVYFVSENDYIPMGHGLPSEIDDINYWRPLIAFELRERMSRRVLNIVHTGYFLPYQQDILPPDLIESVGLEAAGAGNSHA